MTLRLIVTVTEPALSVDQALLAGTSRLGGLACHYEALMTPRATDPAGEAMAAAGEMLLRHAAHPERREATITHARVWLDRAEGLGSEPAVPVGLERRDRTT